ncbi:MAG: radical SAM protein [Candidatus Omnitrophica bacterium]|nr:radical SAM protein [Candidatus Omnitrophota bacterium]
MSQKNYKYIYGPVPSWRLGSSLGIDPLSKGEKVCTFDCVYCQIGKTKILTDKRKTFVKVEDVIEEFDSLPHLKIDYITFSGTGEPTLAKNLGDMIRAIKKIRNEKIAVLTNSSLLNREDVQKDLFCADFVVAKLDSSMQKVFNQVNKPLSTIKIENIIQAVKDFKSCYIGKLALQIMFIEQNKSYVQEIAKIAKEISPDEVQLNTPLRPCRVKPLTNPEMNIIKAHFAGLNTVSVYDAQKKRVNPISSEDTLKRRGKV